MEQTIASKVKAISELQKLKLPWDVTRLGFNISLHGDQIAFTNEGDFVSLKEAREAIQYLLNQLTETKEAESGKTKKNKK